MSTVPCPRCADEGRLRARGEDSLYRVEQPHGCLLCYGEHGGFVREEVAGAYRITPLWNDGNKDYLRSVGKLIAAAKVAGGDTEVAVRDVVASIQVNFDAAMFDSELEQDGK